MDGSQRSARVLRGKTRAAASWRRQGKRRGKPHGHNQRLLAFPGGCRRQAAVAAQPRADGGRWGFSRGGKGKPGGRRPRVGGAAPKKQGGKAGPGEPAARARPENIGRLGKKRAGGGRRGKEWWVGLAANPGCLRFGWWRCLGGLGSGRFVMAGAGGGLGDGGGGLVGGEASRRQNGPR